MQYLFSNHLYYDLIIMVLLFCCFCDGLYAQLMTLKLFPQLKQYELHVSVHVSSETPLTFTPDFMIYYSIKEGLKSDFHKNGSKSPRGLGLVRAILLSAIFCSVKIVTFCFNVRNTYVDQVCKFGISINMYIVLW